MRLTGTTPGRPAALAAAARAAARRCACAAPRHAWPIPGGRSLLHHLRVASLPQAQRTRCRAAEEDGAGGAGGVRARRLLRQQRRLLRRQAGGSDEEGDEAAAAAAPAAASDDAQQQDEDGGGEGTSAAAAAPAPRGASTRSGRAERRRRRAAPRLPPALRPEGGTAGSGKSSSAAYEEEDEERALISEALNLGAADGDDDGGEDGDDLAAAGLDEKDEEDEEEEEEDEEEAAPARAAPGGQKQGQPRRAGAPGGGGGGGEGGGARPGPVVLDEQSSMYIPVLTDEDLAADPPGHRSGYVALIGKPNAGKSTLINALVGQKLSIVTFKPQTTRHRVVGIASDKEYQMILFDTPGIMREQRSKLDERMMAAVVSSIKAAEAIVAVVDAADDPRDALSMFQPGPDWNGPPMAVLLNKSDLVSEQQLASLEEWYKENCRAERVFAGSALSKEPAPRGDMRGGGGAWGGSGEPVPAAGAAAAEGDSIEQLKAWAVSKLPEGPTLYPKDMVSEQPERFFVSEIIREKIFLMYDQEIPYATQVQISEFKERPGAKDYVAATILVERPGQRGILLGAGGAALKRLGAAARRDAEEFLGRPVYLEISVQVAPDWRHSGDRLKEYGYFDPLYVS